MRIHYSLIIAIMFILQSCGGSDGTGNQPTVDPSGNGGSNNNSNQANTGASNRARFTYDCDLNGANGELSIDIEAIGSTGIVFGSGPNPDITGVIGTGDYTYYTAGSLTSATAYYTFTGENSFADFLDRNTLDRFRVQWNLVDGGLIMVVNPFGPQPAQHSCQFKNSNYF